MRRLERREEITRVPQFPVIELDEHAPRILSFKRRQLVFDVIPYEKRGAFLVASCLLMRPSEVRACVFSDYDCESNTLLVNKAFETHRVDAGRPADPDRVAAPGSEHRDGAPQEPAAEERAAHHESSGTGSSASGSGGAGPMACSSVRASSAQGDCGKRSITSW